MCSIFLDAQQRKVDRQVERLWKNLQDQDRIFFNAATVTYHAWSGDRLPKRAVEHLISEGRLQPAGDGLFVGFSQTFLINRS